jgi:hypothetical protein
VKDRVQQTHTNLLKIFSTMGKLYFAGKPLDPAPLRKLITNKFNWDKLRGSGLDFGLVTFNVSDLQPMEVYLEDLNKENVVDFPSLQPLSQASRRLRSVKKALWTVASGTMFPYGRPSAGAIGRLSP